MMRQGARAPAGQRRTSTGGPTPPASASLRVLSWDSSSSACHAHSTTGVSSSLSEAVMTRAVGPGTLGGPRHSSGTLRRSGRTAEASCSFRWLWPCPAREGVIRIRRVESQGLRRRDTARCGGTQNGHACAPDRSKEKQLETRLATTALPF